MLVYVQLVTNAIENQLAKTVAEVTEKDEETEVLQTEDGVRRAAHSGPRAPRKDPTAALAAQLENALRKSKPHAKR